MLYRKMVLHYINCLLEYAMGVSVILDQQMSAECIKSGCDGPDMQVMDIFDPVDVQ
ncbi:hypothetical protein D3C73_852310 [compost metagenome]